jgi:uncharacterized protein (DUF2267 family)
MTAGSAVDSIERTVHKTNEWLADVDRELDTDDRELAWRIVRAHLQLLRRRLTADEAAQLAAELPHLLRGVFYEGYDPGREPERIRDRDEFLARFAERAIVGDEAPRALGAATRVLRRHIAEGEFDDAMTQLPEKIRELLESG